MRCLALSAPSLLALALLAPPAHGGMISSAHKSQKASPSGPAAQSPKPLMHQTGPKAPAKPPQFNPDSYNPDKFNPDRFNASPPSPGKAKKLQPSAGPLPPGAVPRAATIPKEATIPTNLSPQFVKGVKEGETYSTFERIGEVDTAGEVRGGSGLYQNKELE